MSRVTIICDASFCAKTGAGGYGFWIATDNRGKRGGGGAFRDLMDDSLECEMAAMVNSLYTGIWLGLIVEGDEILIQTDCVGALDRLMNRHRCTSPLQLSMNKYVQAMKSAKCLSIKVRHVKGHSYRKEAKFLSNNHCDTTAKRHMRAKRDELLSRTA